MAEQLKWLKSTYSNGDANGNECVELARLPQRRLGVRDSKCGHSGPILSVPSAAAASFLTFVKDAANRANMLL